MQPRYGLAGRNLDRAEADVAFPQPRIGLQLIVGIKPDKGRIVAVPADARQVLGKQVARILDAEFLLLVGARKSEGTTTEHGASADAGLLFEQNDIGTCRGSLQRCRKAG